MRIRKDGFTLVELMVVVALIAIIAGLAAPSLNRLGSRLQIKGAARSLHALFYRAKAEAMKTGVSHTLVFEKAAGGPTYDRVVLFQDDNATSEYRSANAIVRRLQLSRNFPHVTLDPVTFASNDDGNPAVRFDPIGLPRSNSGGFGSGSVTIHDTTSGHTLKLTVSSLGRVSIGVVQ